MLAGALVSLAGCSSPLGVERDALEESIRLWEAAAIDDYSFRYQLNCFCAGPGIQPVDIEVRGGSVVGVSYPDGGSAESYPLQDYPTVTDLFAEIRAALDREPFLVRVEYDRSLGYPREFFADFIRNAVDEEWGFRAAELTPTSS